MNIQLMALSTNGIRLYFSSAPNTGYGAYGYVPQYGSLETRQLHLLHVRLPPANLLHPDEQLHAQHMSNGTYGGSIHAPPTMPTCIVKEITNASYVDGLLVAAQPSDVDGKDFILGISPDLSRTGNLGQTQPQVNQQGPPLLRPTMHLLCRTMLRMRRQERLLRSKLLYCTLRAQYGQ